MPPHRNISTHDKYLPGYPQPGAPQPTPLPLTLLTWVYPLLRLPEREIIRVAGLDVAIYLRLLRFGEVTSCTAASTDTSSLLHLLNGHSIPCSPAALLT